MEKILNSHTITTLKKEISKTNIKGYSKMKKAEIISLIMKYPERFKHIRVAVKKLKITKKELLASDTYNFLENIETEGRSQKGKLETIDEKETNKKKSIKNFNKAIKLLKDGTRTQKNKIIDFANETINDNLFDALEGNRKYIQANGNFVKDVLIKPLKLRELLLEAKKKSNIVRDFVDLDI